MNAPESPLVLTKLRIPAARPRTIPRAHLVELLSSQGKNALVLVCAPAGYGKTTLLADWARSLQKKGCSVAWYSLDSGDNELIPFGTYLIESLIQSLGPLSELAQIAQRIRSSSEVDWRHILPILINAVASSRQECLLILDDYHLITSPAVHHAVAFLLEHLPENFTLAIGSRSDPPLPLARLRTGGRMLEVRAANLRFTPAETSEFLNELMRLDLSPQGIAALSERTEGWVTGLQLAGLSLTDRQDKEQLIASFSGSHRYLVEYLMEEVVSRQSEDVQSFLYATSILERMCAPLGAAVRAALPAAAPGRVSNPSDESILEHLDQSNLFVTALDDRSNWFRYHHLFRDFLRTRLNKAYPGRVNALHRAACEWLAENGLMREAAAHAFQTQDWEYAAAFVEQHSFMRIIHGDLATMYEWLSAFPEEVMQKHAMLCILQCWAWVFSFRRQNREKVERRLEQAAKLVREMENRQEALELTEHAAVVRTFLSMVPDPYADPQALIALAQDLLTHYAEGEPGQFSSLLTIGYAQMALCDTQAASHSLELARQAALSGRLFMGIIESSFHLARLAHSQGRLRQVIQICRQAQADVAALVPQPEQNMPAVGSLDIALGCALLELNQLDEARAHIQHGLDLSGWGMNPYYLMIAYTALFRLSEIQGNSSEALKHLESLEAAWPDITFYTRGLRVNLHLRDTPSDPAVQEDANNWLQSVQPEGPGISNHLPGVGPFGACEVYYLTELARLRAQIATGNPRAALAAIQPPLDLARSRRLTTRAIELLALEAAASLAVDDHERAWATLQHALSLGRDEGLIRAFDHGFDLTPLLSKASRTSTYAGQILSAVARRSPPPSTDLVETLSEREVEILRLLASGATNQDIANQLVITVGTVKSHINHILGKLSARNRTEAVAQARHFHILDD